MFIFSYVLFSEFVLFVLFFFCFVFFFCCFFFFTLGCSTGLALKFHDNLDLVLYTTTTVNNWRFFFYTNPLKFPETESRHLWPLCHFLFYSRFCISAPAPVTQAAIYFLKRGLGLLFSFTLFYFIIIFHTLDINRYQSPIAIYWYR